MKCIQCQGTGHIAPACAKRQSAARSAQQAPIPSQLALEHEGYSVDYPPSESSGAAAAAYTRYAAASSSYAGPNRPTPEMTL